MKRNVAPVEDKMTRPAEDKAQRFIVIRIRPGRAALIDGVRREAGETVKAQGAIAERLIRIGAAEFVREA